MATTYNPALLRKALTDAWEFGASTSITVRRYVSTGNSFLN